MENKLKFTKTGPVSGDCTAPYDVEWNADGIRSVSAFVAAVLLEKRDEWGSIYLIEDERGWMHAQSIEYKYGCVVSASDSFFEKDDDRVIDTITARGGWTNMDYYVRFKSANEGTDERRDETEGSENMGTKGEIVNALIENVSLSMEDHGVLCYYLTLKMNGCGCSYGGRVIGKGYLGAKEFQGYEKGTEALMRIMDVVGVHRWEDIKGKYVRVELPGWGGIVDRIGNIIDDKWFSQKEFFGGD